jgi:glycosyltransferase involved in cell wall biosynthesis
VRTVHVVLPDGVDDPARPSGGNTYDRRLCTALTELGWSVREHAADPALAGLPGLLASLPDGAVVLADGLVASAAPEVMLAAAGRLRLVVLVHRAFGTPAEAALLRAARAVVTTSAWSAASLPGRVAVAPPGVDPAPLATGSTAGTRLLCVAVVAPHKGYDLLVSALADVPGPTLCCVGSLVRDPAFAARVRAAAPAGRVRFAGPLTGADLDAAYAGSDLLVLPSRGETYGMVVTEALARGIPVLATRVGGVPEALGRAPDGSVPGLLVAPEAPALAAALREWVADPDLRARLRRSARDVRPTLADWAATARRVAAVLERA